MFGMQMHPSTLHRWDPSQEGATVICTIDAKVVKLMNDLIKLHIVRSGWQSTFRIR